MENPKVNNKTVKLWEENTGEYLYELIKGKGTREKYW